VVVERGKSRMTEPGSRAESKDYSSILIKQHKQHEHSEFFTQRLFMLSTVN